MEELIKKYINEIEGSCENGCETVVSWNAKKCAEIAIEFANKCCEDKWISVEDRLPEELQTVWCYSVNKNWIMLGCITYEDGWLWAESNGIVYMEDGKITSECECEDDYDVTHWQPLPSPPKSLTDKKN